MESLRDLGNALVIALVSIGLLIGALSISSVDFASPATATSTIQEIPSPIPLTATSTIPPTPTLDFLISSATPSTIPSATISPTPPAKCQIPFGWIQITVQAGETLDSIAAKFRVSAIDVQNGNCLPTVNIIPGAKLYIPAVPTNTVSACTPGAAGWTKGYTVKQGDNLYRIGIDHYTSLDLMRKVNCRTGDTIYTGEVLWVPNVATRTQPPSPLPGSTVTLYPTEPLTLTALPFTATIMPISTLPPTDTPVPAAPVIP